MALSTRSCLAAVIKSSMDEIESWLGVISPDWAITSPIIAASTASQINKTLGWKPLACPSESSFLLFSTAIQSCVRLLVSQTDYP